MSDIISPRIQWGDSDKEPTTAEKEGPRVEDHWLVEAKQWLVSNEYATEEELSRCVVPTMDELLPHITDFIESWRQPRAFFGESSPKSNESESRPVLLYLIRILYEEMYQIQRPDPTDKRGIGYSSMGGLLTHIPSGAKKDGYDRHISGMITMATRIRETIPKLLTAPLPTQTVQKLGEPVGITAMSSLEQPMQVEDCFITLWKALSKQAQPVLEGKGKSTSSYADLKTLLQSLLAVRTTPEFQFMFASYPSFKTLTILEEKIKLQHKVSTVFKQPLHS